MLKGFIKLVVAAGCVVVLGLAAPVFAQSDNAPDRPVNSQADGGGGSNGNRGMSNRGQDVSDFARDRATQIRDQVRARTVQLRTDVCEQKEQRLNQLIPSLSRRATALLSAIDGVYARVQTFYETGRLTVDNYDEIKTNVDTAQTNAAAATQALQDFEFDLNCDEPEAGNQLSSFRIAAKETKEALRTYRAELVNLISAMRAAAAEDAIAEEQE